MSDEYKNTVDINRLHRLKGKQVRILYDLVTVLREYISIYRRDYGRRMIRMSIRCIFHIKGFCDMVTDE